MTGLAGKYMRQHEMENNIWDKGKLGVMEGVLGTVDQPIINWCIIEEVITHQQNLAVAY